MLTRRTCWGLAAYVGHPHRWVWSAATDRLGRAIATDIWPIYDEEFDCDDLQCGCRLATHCWRALGRMYLTDEQLAALLAPQ